jgi:hypothetical protein
MPIDDAVPLLGVLFSTSDQELPSQCVCSQLTDPLSLNFNLFQTKPPSFVNIIPLELTANPHVSKIICASVSVNFEKPYALAVTIPSFPINSLFSAPDV